MKQPLQKQEKSRGGRWQKGQSGNPAGRKPGTGNVTALREQIAERLPNIIETLAQAAEGGDVQAARILLDRVLPPMKHEEIHATVVNESADEQRMTELNEETARRIIAELYAKY